MARVRLIVAAVAVAAAGLTVAIVALTSDEPPPREPPPLFIELGARQDAEARRLRAAIRLYERGRLDEAAELFASLYSLEARVGLALAEWPDALEPLEELPDERAIVRLHRGVALAAVGDDAEARRELALAERIEPDTPYALRAEDFLHPRFVPGRPFFLPSREPMGALLAGIRFQRRGKPVSAQRAFDAAARASPSDPDALTAAAVARFDKDDPAAAFSRLGPLARRFPRAQTVRFHLGLLLLWSVEVEGARRQLERAHALDPRSRLGREAKRFLDRLRSDGTS